MSRPALLSLVALLLSFVAGIALHGNVPGPALETPCPARGTIIGKVTRRHARPGKEGVPEVVVWVRLEGDRPFTLEPDDLDAARGGWQREVVMNVSRKAFVPRMAVLFPAYRKPGAKTLVRTGQTFAINNGDTEPHAPRLGVAPGSPNTTSVVMLPPSQPRTTYELWPDPHPIVVSCCLHPGMRAYVWAFDHPFAAVTNDAGEYILKNVPAGVPLRIQAWRPETGYLARFGRAGDPIDVSVGRTRECLFSYPPQR